MPSPAFSCLPISISQTCIVYLPTTGDMGINRGAQTQGGWTHRGDEQTGGHQCFSKHCLCLYSATLGPVGQPQRHPNGWAHGWVFFISNFFILQDSAGYTWPVRLWLTITEVVIFKYTSQYFSKPNLIHKHKSADSLKCP